MWTDETAASSVICSNMICVCVCVCYRTSEISGGIVSAGKLSWSDFSRRTLRWIQRPIFITFRLILTISISRRAWTTWPARASEWLLIYHFIFDLFSHNSHHQHMFCCVAQLISDFIQFLSAGLCRLLEESRVGFLFTGETAHMYIWLDCRQKPYIHWRVCRVFTSQV